MGFIRIEDGAASETHAASYYFVTTGGNAGEHNLLGRLYHLRLNPSDPTKPAQLTLVYSADDVIAAGGDTAISPDNIDVSSDWLMINEDGTDSSRPVMQSLGRDGSVWRFALHGASGQVDPDGERIGELDPEGPGRYAVDPTIATGWFGFMETSGVVDTEEIWGPNTWLVDVQAHRPQGAGSWSTAAQTFEDGQLLLVQPAN